MTNVLDIASLQGRWLFAKEKVLAQNVANANTPGYKTANVVPFEAMMHDIGLQMTSTSPLHLRAEVSQVGSYAQEDAGDGATFYSGGDVNLDQEMLKSSEVMRDYALNASVVKTFHSMISQAARG
ncbi:flagellar basal body rod protein FlgB [Rhodomicrobium vannielii ATCC 17100]|uniref:Flagellar basal body rod protein FlgB n=1 Tax=Rhodomicrobium udaipurense TaxID=1202716 RepID=A0A8I1KHF4_9HYPH|nr:MULTISPECIES: flagellar basal body rod C-terminal domain-containing protein [Rhodomicrobium]KAI95784.1 flagellar basal body rod protein FlgB [Rhodomicrobium udaipurense JA643]MBJ7535943.1 flagellar basal body rod protein FlgB [Rhodomicrobium vannielii ATCC 17100]MBJ7543655.1 flagellar basal body rod protein FlgB [Rhodomicrobium udaipurense]